MDYEKEITVIVVAAIVSGTDLDYTDLGQDGPLNYKLINEPRLQKITLEVTHEGKTSFFISRFRAIEEKQTERIRALERKLIQNIGYKQYPIAKQLLEEMYEKNIYPDWKKLVESAEELRHETKNAEALGIIKKFEDKISSLEQEYRALLQRIEAEEITLEDVSEINLFVSNAYNLNPESITFMKIN